MSVDAIYLLTPTSQNVDRIIADFSFGGRTYKSANLFFIDGKSPSSGLLSGANLLSGIDDGLAQKLTGSLPSDVLKAFVELYCNFWGGSSVQYSQRFRPSDQLWRIGYSR